MFSLIAYAAMLSPFLSSFYFIAFISCALYADFIFDDDYADLLFRHFLSSPCRLFF